MSQFIKLGQTIWLSITRNEDEWKSAWHSEKHVRCRDQLRGHIYWACEKDIYRLDKKPKASDPQLPLLVPFGSPFIRKLHANTVIKPWSGYVRLVNYFL